MNVYICVYISIYIYIYVAMPRNFGPETANFSFQARVGKWFWCEISHAPEFGARENIDSFSKKPLSQFITFDSIS